VINLSPEKQRVFAEAFRVLRPGGRLMISDIVLERPLPAEAAAIVEGYLGCVGGAAVRGRYLETIAKAGFREVEVVREASAADAFSIEDERIQEGAAQLGLTSEQVTDLARTVTSVHVQARK
jgi:SAM-dependent methyltransferase